MASITQWLLVPVSSLRKEHLAQWPPFCALINMTKNALQIMSLAAYESEANNREGKTGNKPILTWLDWLHPHMLVTIVFF